MRSNRYSAGNSSEQDLLLSELLTAKETLAVSTDGDFTLCPLSLNPFQVRRDFWAIVHGSESVADAPLGSAALVFTRNGKPVLTFPLQFYAAIASFTTMNYLGSPVGTLTSSGPGNMALIIGTSTVWTSRQTVKAVADAAYIKLTNLRGADIGTNLEAHLAIYSETE